MKLTILAKDLATALQQVRPVINTRSPLPILSNVLLRAKDNVLSVTASNMEQMLTVHVQCAVHEPGETTLPHGRLMLAAGHLRDNVAIFASDKHATTLSAANANIRLLGMAADEYPPAEAIETTTEITMPFWELAKWLGKLAPYMSQDDTRYMLCGVYFTSEEDQLLMVACDGHRLLKVTPGVPVGELSAIVPAAAIKALNGLDAENVKLRFSANRVEVWSAEWTLTSQLIDANYPNWKQVVPDSREHFVLVDRDEAIKAVALNSVTEFATMPRVLVTAENGEVSFETESADIGNARASIPRRNAGNPFTFAVNPRYLADALRICDQPQTEIQAKNSLAPVVIEEPNLMAVVWTMRLTTA